MAQPSAQQRQQVTAQLAPVLATATTVATVAPTVIALLAAVGVSAAAASAALTLTGATSANMVLLPTGPASRATAASEQIYRAAYLLAASERIQARLGQGMTIRQALTAERGNHRAHILAAANRRRAAKQVDSQAQRHGPLLGWYARMDENTSTECAAANGRNFLVTSRPVIGWPGSVHPNCRCRAGVAHVGAGMVDQVATAAERREAVA